jgi:hypothetical protein
VVGSKVLRWGEALQGAVWRIVVVEMLEAVDQRVQLGEGFGQIVDRAEPVAPTAVGTLDRTVELPGHSATWSLGRRWACGRRRRLGLALARRRTGTG